MKATTSRRPSPLLALKIRRAHVGDVKRACWMIAIALRPFRGRDFSAIAADLVVAARSSIAHPFEAVWPFDLPPLGPEDDARLAEAIAELYICRDDWEVVMGGFNEFDAERFVEVAQEVGSIVTWGPDDMLVISKPTR